jgi:hypothetical protein
METQMKTVAVINLLTNADKEVTLILESLNAYAHIIESEGVGDAPTLDLAPDPKNPPANASAVLVLAEHSDSAGAAGYHFLGDDGRPMLRAFLDGTESNELLRDPKGAGDSLLAIAQHELAEAVGDEDADLYIAEPWTGPDGITWTLRAKEHSDPGQGQCTTMTLKDGTIVDCGNFVNDAYFNPKAPKGTKLDYMGLFSTPGELASGGYQIAARITQEKDVFADMVMHRGGGPHTKARASKLKPSARTARRIAQIVKMLRAS